MTAPTHCPPPQVMLTEYRMPLAAEPTGRLHISGLAVDERRLYVAAIHTPSGPLAPGRRRGAPAGELWVYDRRRPDHVPRTIAGLPPTRGLAVDRGRVFLLHAAGGTVQAVDPDSAAERSVIDLEPVRQMRPDRLAVSNGASRLRRKRPAPGHLAILAAAEHRICVANAHGGSLTIIDSRTAARAPGLDIALPAAPSMLTIDESGRTVLALLPHTGARRAAVAIVELDTRCVEIATLPADCCPRDIAYDSTSGLIYVATACDPVAGALVGGTATGAPAGSPASGCVLVIDRDTGTMAGPPIGTGAAVTALSFARSGGRALLYALTGGVVQVIDASGRTTTAEITLGPSPTAGIEGVSGAPPGSVPSAESAGSVRPRGSAESNRTGLGARTVHAVADPTTGEIFLAERVVGRAGGDPSVSLLSRLVPLVGGTPIARHPKVVDGSVGRPTGGPRATPDGGGVLQQFIGGTGFATPDLGAVLVDTRHVAPLLCGPTDAVAGTADGPGSSAPPASTGLSSLAGALGNPVGDTRTQDRHRVTYFERGLITTLRVDDAGGVDPVRIPLHVSVVPALAADSTAIMVTDHATVARITDERGLTVSSRDLQRQAGGSRFDPAGTRLRPGGGVVRGTDPAADHPLWQISSRSGHGSQRTFLSGGRHPTLFFEITEKPSNRAGAATAADSTYRWAARTSGFAAVVTGRARFAEGTGAPIPDLLGVEHLGSGRRAISLVVPSAASPRPFSVLLAAIPAPILPGPQITRQYRLDALTLVAGQRICLRLDDAGGELHIANHGPQLTLNLRLRRGGGRLSRARRVTIGAGMTTVLRPASWGTAALTAPAAPFAADSAASGTIVPNATTVEAADLDTVQIHLEERATPDGRPLRCQTL